MTTDSDREDQPALPPTNPADVDQNIDVTREVSAGKVSAGKVTDPEDTDAGVIEGSDEDRLWDQLGEILEAFSNAWSEAPPEPEIGDFISQVDSESFPEFQSLALIELIKVELEYRAGGEFEQISVAQYAEKWPAIKQDGELPPDLLYEQARLGKPGTGPLDETLPIDATPSQRAAPGAGPRAGPGAGLGDLVRMIDPDMTRTTSLLAKSKIHNFQPGDTVDDFDLLARLGKGAFASVYLARQNSMQRLVALKISADQGVEGQTLAQLDHPHIVRVYDQRVIGEPPVRLMYMQYIAGGSLLDVIRKIDGERTGPEFVAALNKILDDTGEPAPVESGYREWLSASDWNQVVSRIGAQLSDALEYSHEHGVLHRDIKPANVLVDLHGFPKLVDFNISFSSEVAGTTAASFFGGSLAYMSPEQLEACSIDHKRQPGDLGAATDIYSLGIVLYELICSRRPFDVSSEGLDQSGFLNEMVRCRRNGLVEEERKAVANGNELLTDAVERCLEPREKKRFQSASTLSRQLRWAADKTISAYVEKPAKWWHWKKLVAAYPFLTFIFVGLAIAIFATEFVTFYNLQEAVDLNDEHMFDRIRSRINIVVFPLVMLVCVLILRPIINALRSVRQNSISQASGKQKEKGQSASEDSKLLLPDERFSSAVLLNLNLGHYLAIAFMVSWTVSGFLYPIFLTSAGAAVTPSTWYNFVLSHVVAGLITGSYLFCSFTAFSLVAIHPRLMLGTLKREIDVETRPDLRKIQSRTVFYQILAIAAPLAAIAMLIYLRDNVNTFAVGGLSVGALFGLIVLRWTSNKIEESLKTIPEMDR
ncbi:MAG: serine/threonine-protein kinase [Planctomycetota bacterium]